MLATYCQTCCAIKHSKNLCSTIFTLKGPQCGRLLSTSSMILPCQSSTSTTLWSTETASYETGACTKSHPNWDEHRLKHSFFHFLALSGVLHLLPNLVEISIKRVVFGYHRRSRSTCNSSNFLNKNCNCLFDACLMKHSRSKFVDTKLKPTSVWLNLSYKVIALNKNFQGKNVKKIQRTKMTSNWHAYFVDMFMLWRLSSCIRM